MKTVDEIDGESTQSAPSGTPQPDTASITAAVRALLSATNGIDDPIDRQLVTEAATFVEAPTDEFVGIAKHEGAIAAVMMGYISNGAEAPPQVEALYVRLLELLCRHHINVIHTESKQAVPDLPRVEKAKQQAKSAALILSKEYKNGTLLGEVEALG